MPHQTIYRLTFKDEIKAMLVIRKYADEPRLKHAAVMPCLAFSYDVNAETLAAFIKAAVAQYRKENHEVFHFSTSEEDTQENWYTEKHPQLPVLAKALQLAGFNFLGCFENYFSERSITGRHLLAFSAVFLGIQEAKQCLEDSKLSFRARSRLASILLEIPPQPSARAEYEIYKIIRLIAYPEDYTTHEKIQLINKSCTLLKLDPANFISILQKQTTKFQSDLFEAEDSENSLEPVKLTNSSDFLENKL